MTIHHQIRPADLRKDRNLLAQLQSRLLNPDASEPRFRWLYEENPHGSAHAWLAIDNSTGAAIGTAAAFPRQIHTTDGLQTGCVLGDFAIDPRHRSLGVALRLQQACLDHIGSASCTFGLDFPSTRMMAIYARMRIPAVGQMVRWAKLLRADRVTTRAVRSARLGGVLAGPINLLLHWKDNFLAARGSWTIEQHQSECGEEFSALARAVGSRYGTCVDRSARYLNWRYRKHPYRRFEMLTARKGAALVGYVVYSQTEGDATIVDLFGQEDNSTWTALVAEAISILRRRGVTTVSASTLITDRRCGVFRRLGFRARESCPLIIYGGQVGRAQHSNLGPSWLLMDGDRDT